ncbi:MAG: oligosaccharide flippase family protein [Clostridia bacterium]|nr:oligosaccharide flippase family protein [Clostridia bacterium]
MNSSKQIKLGAMMSYFAIAFNMLSGLIYTPWMISQIGQSNYGLYTLAHSLITMLVMDFGMSAAVSRFVSKYRAEGNQQKINDFLGIVYKLYLTIDAVIFAALIVVSFFINNIYDNLSASELSTFKVLYVIVGLFSVISFPFTNLNGILTSYENFVGLKLADLFHKVFIIVAMVISLLLGYGVYALVTVNAVSGILTIIIKLIIIKKKTPVKVNFRYFEKSTLKEIFGFSMWTTIGGLAQRMIFNITPSIIVAVSLTGAIGSAIFGLATTIEGYVYTFATAINGMFMPRISKLVYQGKKDTELMDLMIKIGRLQCIIIGVLVVGFISFGKSFIVDIWNKPDFTESYLCAIFLIIPSFFYLPLQIANTTIIVENKVKLQSFVFIIMGVINVVLSIILSEYYGALGASFSIFVAYMVRTILMVVIHVKVLKLNMWRFFKETFLKITPFLSLMLGIGLLLENFNPMNGGFLRFTINGVIFVGFFGVTMLLFCMNEYEKNLFLGVFKKVLKKIKK